MCSTTTEDFTVGVLAFAAVSEVTTLPRTAAARAMMPTMMKAERRAAAVMMSMRETYGACIHTVKQSGESDRNFLDRLVDRAPDWAPDRAWLRHVSGVSGTLVGVRHPDPLARSLERPHQMAAAEQAHPEQPDADRSTDPSDDRCPHCGVGLTTPIPPENKHLHGASTHYRREIGVEVNDSDGLLYFVCPDCHGAWPRSVTGLTRGVAADMLAERAAKAVAEHDADVAVLRDPAHVESVLRTHGDVIRFAIGLAGLRWLGWRVSPQMGNRLWLLCEPVTGDRMDATAHRSAIQMIANATGWDKTLLSIYGPKAPMVQFSLEDDPNFFHQPPTTSHND